jgi:hypothetical protein
MIVALAGAVPFVLTQAKADTLGVDFTSTPPDQGASTFNLGYSFTAVNAVTVTGLAAFDNGSLDNFDQDQQVGLWDSGGDLLASAYVGFDQSSTQLGFWGVTAITGVSLIAGDTYIVGAQGGYHYTYGSPLNVDPDITNVTDAWISVGSGSNNPLVEPTNADGGEQGYFGGNVLISESSTTPEPGTFLLLTPALGGLFLLRRKRLS